MKLRSPLHRLALSCALLPLVNGCRSEPRPAPDEGPREVAVERGEPRAARAAVGGAVPAELANRRAAPDAELGIGGVGIAEAWSFETQEPVSHRPLVEEGRVYFGDWGGELYAVDLESGRELWRRKVQEPNRQWPWHGLVGTGVLVDELLIEATAEGVAVAVDKRTGEPRWMRRFVEEGQEAGNIGALLAHEGLVYIGVASVEEALAQQREDFEPDFRGRVLALDVETGEEVWRLDLAEPPATGVAVWSGFALDPATQTLFFTTSNNYRPPATEWSDAILAVDAKSGAPRWAHQATANDVWTMAQPLGPDYAFGAAPQLFEARDAEGRSLSLVGAGQKSGMYHALDRESGEKVWEASVGYGGVGGGVLGEGAVEGGRVFVLSNNRFEPRQPLEDQQANVEALDAATGAYVWVKREAQPAASHSGDVLAGEHFLTGSCDGRVRAWRALDGELVWTSREHAGIASALQVADGTLLFGAGLPASFGGVEGRAGVFAYRSTGGRPRAAEAGFRRESGPPRAIRVTALDFTFEPRRIEVAPGERIELQLVNRGDTLHNIELELPTGELELAQPVAPGATGTLRFTAPIEPGEYTIYCPVDQHRQRGMTGSLVVREP